MNCVKYLSIALLVIAGVSTNQAGAMFGRLGQIAVHLKRTASLNPQLFRSPRFRRMETVKYDDSLGNLVSVKSKINGFNDSFGNLTTKKAAARFSGPSRIQSATGWLSTKSRAGLQTSRKALQTTFNKGSEVFTTSVKPGLVKAAKKGHKVYNKSVQPKLEEAGTKAWEKCEPYYKQIEPQVQPLQLSFFQKMAVGSKHCYNFFRRRHSGFNQSAKKTQEKMTKKALQVPAETKKVDIISDYDKNIVSSD